MAKRLLYTTTTGGMWEWAPFRENSWDEVRSRGTVNVTPDDMDTEPVFVKVSSASLWKMQSRWDRVNGVTKGRNFGGGEIGRSS